MPVEPIVPPVYGDLKMVVASGNGMKISIIFRSYPRARRHRPMTKTEFTHAQKVSPLVLRTLNSTREVIIKMAGEGVYVFLAEPEGSATVRA